uniref:NADH-ubiquinone oxidoreductase chain 3 n=1 Tax=Apharyngostrigea pipientis TaxID=234879 RepID=A0A8A2H9F6_9TREM|nr:NADH dehydrogenase subunit 3 [Apharyngostrigea pipientis]QSV37704.1 NADH dehydrogenase subunit 3 [Apharyngostrigea pipientis]
MLYVFSCLVLSLFIVFLVVIYSVYNWNWGIADREFGRVWVSPFECGFLGNVLVENVFSYTYFVLLVFFVVFDLEISLLINIPYQGVLFKNFFFFFFFLFLLVVGYFFEVSKGYVSWNY